MESMNEAELIAMGVKPVHAGLTAQEIIERQERYRRRVAGNADASGDLEPRRPVPIDVDEATVVAGAARSLRGNIDELTNGEHSQHLA